MTYAEIQRLGPTSKAPFNREIPFRGVVHLWYKECASTLSFHYETSQSMNLGSRLGLTGLFGSPTTGLFMQIAESARLTDSV